jgi:hypothetical protein
VIYYERALDGERTKRSTHTDDWDKAADARDLGGRPREWAHQLGPDRCSRRRVPLAVGARWLEALRAAAIRSRFRSRRSRAPAAEEPEPV